MGCQAPSEAGTAGARLFAQHFPKDDVEKFRFSTYKLVVRVSASLLETALVLLALMSLNTPMRVMSRRRVQAACKATMMDTMITLKSILVRISLSLFLNLFFELFGGF